MIEPHIVRTREKSKANKQKQPHEYVVGLKKVTHLNPNAFPSYIFSTFSFPSYNFYYIVGIKAWSFALYSSLSHFGHLD